MIFLRALIFAHFADFFSNPRQFFTANIKYQFYITYFIHTYLKKIRQNVKNLCPESFCVAKRTSIRLESTKSKDSTNGKLF